MHVSTFIARMHGSSQVWQRAHLHACKHVHCAFVALHPQIQGLPPFHHNARWHWASKCVRDCAFAIVHSHEQRGQELRERAVFLGVLRFLLLEDSVRHKQLDCILQLADRMHRKLHHCLPCMCGEACCRAACC
jgi:hypothetical protein